MGLPDFLPPGGPFPGGDRHRAERGTCWWQVFFFCRRRGIFFWTILMPSAIFFLLIPRIDVPQPPIPPWLGGGDPLPGLKKFLPWGCPPPPALSQVAAD